VLLAVTFFDIADFTKLTQSILLSLNKLLFPMVGPKISFIRNFTYKYSKTILIR
jgi:hypothetical protein